jgi:hypothetical protein
VHCSSQLGRYGKDRVSEGPRTVRAQGDREGRLRARAADAAGCAIGGTRGTERSTDIDARPKPRPET